MFLSVASILMPEVNIACLSPGLLLFRHFNIVRVESDHLCCFPSWLPVDQPYFALCPSMPSFPLLREDSAGWAASFF